MDGDRVGGGSAKGWRWQESALTETGRHIIMKIGEGSFDDPTWRARYKREYDRSKAGSMTPEERRARRELERLSQRRRRKRLRESTNSLTSALR